MKNWKTTLSGIASIIGGIALFVNHPEQIEAAFASVSIGFGLIFAKDHNVSGTGKPKDMKADDIAGGGIKNP